MAVSDIRGNQTFHGTITFAGDVVLPDGVVDDAAIHASAAIAATKLEHQHVLSRQLADDTTAIAAGDELLYIVRGAAGEVVSIEAAIVTAATGADRTVTVDLQKSTAGGAFSTVLTTTVNITNATTVLVPVAGVVNASTGALVDGDILKLVWTVAGSAGNQAKGLVCTINLREDAA